MKTFNLPYLGRYNTAHLIIFLSLLLYLAIYLLGSPNGIDGRWKFFRVITQEIDDIPLALIFIGFAFLTIWANIMITKDQN